MLNNRSFSEEEKLSMVLMVYCLYQFVKDILNAVKIYDEHILLRVMRESLMMPRLDKKSLSLKFTECNGDAAASSKHPSLPPPIPIPVPAASSGGAKKKTKQQSWLPCTSSSKASNNNCIEDIPAIYPNELAVLLTKKSSSRLLVLDCRGFPAYNALHILGAVNVSCADSMSKKRLQQGRLTLLDAIPCKEGKEIFKNRSTQQIIIYDDNTATLENLASSKSIYIVLSILQKEGLDISFLAGGLETFREHFPQLCTNSLRLPCNSAQPSPPCSDMTVTCILPHLYLGNDSDASDRHLLDMYGITYILNVSTHIPLYFQSNAAMHYKRLPALDSCHQNMKQYFEEASEFIDQARENGANVIVHCQAGISRSATIVIAYLLKHTTMKMNDAHRYVKNKRPIISPNLSFMGQLVEYEANLNKGETPRVLQPPTIVETLV